MTGQPDVAFDEVWKRIHDLEGKPVRLAVRGQIDIVKVDERGVVRRTSRGNITRMSIDSFSWTVNALNQSKHLSREEVLQGIRRWESSGVIATLAATGLYEFTRSPSLGLRVRAR